MANINSYLQYNDPLLIVWRKGDSLDPYVDKNESSKIINNVIILSEIPDKLNHVQISGYTEVLAKDVEVPSSNQFIVDYQTGFVTFNGSENGKTVSATYKGKGQIMYPASRVYGHRPDQVDVYFTLQEVIDNHIVALDVEENLATLVAEVNAAMSDVEAATNYAQAQGDYAKAQGDAANIATTNANDATTQANAARDAANTATTQANTARDAANAAATNADTKAGYAQTQGDYAKNQGDYAKAQGDYAKAQGLALSHMGTYDNTVTYKQNNIVSYNGSTYIAITTTVGNLPTNSAYWRLVVAKAPVDSVNGKVGAVILDAADVNAIKNLGNVPSIQADITANRPSAGVVNRLFLSINEKKLYRDNGASWDTLSTNVSVSTTNGNIVVDGTEVTVYTHPSSHPATMITEDSAHRFATDAEKATWNAMLPKSGGTMTDYIVLHADPVLPMHPVTKQYLDAVKQSLDIKDSVRVATTGVITLTGIQTIDGVSLVAGNRVLVKDQATASQNGIYIVASGAWTRSIDADSSAKVTSGLYVFIEEGNTNGDTGWTLTTNDPIVLGTTNLSFTQFSGAGQIIAGTGLSKSGNTLSIANTGVPAGTYTKVTVNAQGQITLGANPTTLVEYGIGDATPSSHIGSGGNAHASATQSVAGFMSAADKSKLDGISSGAQANQNTFSSIKIGASTIVASSVSDLLEIVAGDSVTITPNVASKLITLAIALTDNAHGNRSGGALHAAVTTSSNGFMIASDKSKLDGIQANAINQTSADARYLQLSGGNVIGIVTFDANINMDSVTDGANQASRAITFNVTDASSVKSSSQLKANASGDLVFSKLGNGESLVHTDSNHGSTGDPHTQYLLKTGGTIIGNVTIGGSGNFYLDSIANTASNSSRAIFFYATDGSAVKTTNNSLQVNSSNDLVYIKAGGSAQTIYHTGNHANTGDPHTQYALLDGIKPFTGSVVVRKDNARLNLDRPSGQTGQYAGLGIYDNNVGKAFIFWDYNNSKWILSENGGTNYYDIFHAGNHASETAHALASASNHGFMSKADFTRLSGVEAGATATAYPVTSESMPSSGLKEGLVWYKASTDTAQMYLNGAFRDVGGVQPIVSTAEPTANLKAGLIWFNPSNNDTKIYLNGSFRNAGGGTTGLVQSRWNTTLPSASATITHGLNTFVPSLDVMFVYKNSTYMQQGVDYTLSSDGTQILVSNGTWAAGSEVNVLVLSSVPTGNAFVTSRLKNLVTIASNGTTNIPIGIPSFNKDSDILEVVQDNLQLYEGNQYVVNSNGTSIDLQGYSLNTGDQLMFYVWKQVRTSTNALDAGLLVDKTITNAKLADDIKIGSLATLGTTSKSSVVSAINEVNTNANTSKNDLADGVANTSLNLTNGIQKVTSTRDIPYNVLNINGRTLVNLLGIMGNFESTSVLYGNGNSTFALDNSNYAIGTASIKFTASANGAMSIYISSASGKFSVNSSKYYLAVGSLKNGTATNGTYLIAQGVGSSLNKTGNIVTSTTQFLESYVTIDPSQMAGMTEFRIYAYASGTTLAGQYAYADAIRLYEISSTEKTYIDSLSVASAQTYIRQNYPYVDDVKHVNAVYIQNRGRNLANNEITSWSGNSVYLSSNSDGFMYKTSNTGYDGFQEIPIIAGQQYTLSALGYASNADGTSASLNMQFFDVSGASISGTLAACSWSTATIPIRSSSTVTAPSNAVKARIYPVSTSKTVYFKDVTLNLGATALAFELQKLSYLYLPTCNLRSNLDGTVQDKMYTDGEGKPRVVRRFREIVLDGLLAWSFGSDLTGFKYVIIPFDGVNQSEVTVKYDGKILPATAALNASDQSQSAGGYLRISISDTESGWGESYTPTVDEIKAYFYGWKMYEAVSSSDLQKVGSYNGTGTKAWSRIDLTNQTSTLPTASYVGYTPYRLIYQLTQSIDESIEYEGSLMLHSGDNQIEVGSGIIVREAAKPYVNVNAAYINQTESGVSGAGVSKLKYNTDKIISVYKNNVRDVWTLDNLAGYAYGKYRAYIKPNLYDYSASYSVTYLALDTYSLGIAPLSISGEYASNIKEEVNALARSVVEAKTALSVVQTQKANKQQPQWITPTLMNGWVSFDTTEVARYKKDELGYVRLDGRIKGGSVGGGTIIMILPIGYRPSQPLSCVTASNNGTTSNVIELYIDTSGNVKIFGTSIGNAYIDLSNVSFLAEK